MSKNQNKLTGSEMGIEALDFSVVRAETWRDGKGLFIGNFYPNSIVKLNDGKLLTATGQYSLDNGRSWSKRGTVIKGGNNSLYGLLRLPDGGLGCYYSEGEGMDAALGNASNNWYFRRSDDEGRTWSQPVKITIDGLTMGLVNTMFALKDGRLVLVTYSQFLSPMKRWGASWGTYKGLRVKTETEGHFGQMEVVRVYFSDDCGREWKACDGWVLGFRGGFEKWVDSFVEANGVELNDRRILLMGRSLVGRMYASVSSDRGESFGYAGPTGLMTSDSPGALARLPNGDLLFVWNQISREENRRGLRRSRLSSAISKDEGATWLHHKNIFSIGILSDRRFVPEDPVMTPIAGDDEVGELPDDFELWHYPVINIVNGEIYLSYLNGKYEIRRLDEGEDPDKCPGAYDEFEFGKDGSYPKWLSSGDTLILPVDWFYN
jgi:BNR/Asp-box repeat.